MYVWMMCKWKELNKKKSREKISFLKWEKFYYIVFPFNFPFFFAVVRIDVIIPIYWQLRKNIVNEIPFGW